MSLARLVVAAVRTEGRTKSEVARDYRVSRQWVHELIKRFDAEGEAGLEPRSRRPRGSPHRTLEALEDQIVELRKALTPSAKHGRVVDEPPDRDGETSQVWGW